MSRRSVLVVDDDDDLLVLLTDFITAAGFDVARACDGIDALSFLYANRPRVLLIDLTMPRMDGVELIEQIRSDPSLRDVGIVAMSGTPARLARARMAGADETLCKPLDQAVLVRSLIRRCGG